MEIAFSVLVTAIKVENEFYYFFDSVIVCTFYDNRLNLDFGMTALNNLSHGQN